MSKKILVTDSLFVKDDDHLEKLQRSGLVVHRLDEVCATEDQLCKSIRGMDGYILGGIERVTESVIECADSLRAIAFTGSGYTEFIPGHELATRKGIAISAAIGANARSVAEYSMTLVLMMVRNVPMLTIPVESGGKDFYVARELSGLNLGIIGYGRVGKELARIAHVLGMRVLVHNRTKPVGVPDHIEVLALEELLRRADVVSIHVDAEHGIGVVGANELGCLRDGAILINAAFPEAVDIDALAGDLRSGRLRAAFDRPPSSVPMDLPVGHFVFSNSQTGFNTREANRRISDRVVASIINLLERGDDTDLVNPTYRQYRPES
jgi:phosphoglycerate dehydrogenase-like enzyme